jgi:hypothetical protein
MKKCGRTERLPRYVLISKIAHKNAGSFVSTFELGICARLIFRFSDVDGNWRWPTSDCLKVVILLQLESLEKTAVPRHLRCLTLVETVASFNIV